MPASQPESVQKPARKAVKPKPASTEQHAALELADLMTELQFLKGLVQNLQEEVIFLKQSASTALPDEAIERQEAGLSPEPGPAPDPAPEAAAIVREHPPVTQEHPGLFTPFEPAAFAEDFEAAFAAPEPIDWGTWAEEEEEEPEPEEEHSRLDSAKSDRDALHDMMRRHSGLVEEVVAFNQHNPPDFFVESPFDEAVRVLGIGRQAEGSQAEPPKLIELSAPSAHDIMAELVAEASQAQAVLGAESFPAPPPDDLSSFVPPMDFTMESNAWSEPGEDLDQSYAGLPGLLQAKRLPEEITARIPARAAIRALLLPLSLDEDCLRAGAPRPLDAEAVKEFEEELGIKVEVQFMPLEDVVRGLREGFSTRESDDFRGGLLSGAGPQQPKTLLEKAGEFFPFLKRGA